MATNITSTDDAMRIADEKEANPVMDKPENMDAVEYQTGKFVEIHTATIRQLTDPSATTLSDPRRKRLQDIMGFWKEEKGELQNLLFCNLPDTFFPFLEESDNFKMKISAQTLANGETVNMLTAYGNMEDLLSLQFELSNFAEAHILMHMSMNNTYMPLKKPFYGTPVTENIFQATA